MICTSWGDVETEILDSDTHNVLAYGMGDMHISPIRTMYTRHRKSMLLSQIKYRYIHRIKGWIAFAIFLKQIVIHWMKSKAVSCPQACCIYR